MAIVIDRAANASPAAPSRGSGGRPKGAPNVRTLKLATAVAILAQRVADLELRLGAIDGIAANQDAPTAIRRATARAVKRALLHGTAAASTEQQDAGKRPPRLRAGRDPMRSRADTVARLLTPDPSVKAWLQREAAKVATHSAPPPIGRKELSLEDVL